MTNKSHIPQSDENPNTQIFICASSSHIVNVSICPALTPFIREELDYVKEGHVLDLELDDCECLVAVIPFLLLGFWGV